LTKKLVTNFILFVSQFSCWLFFPSCKQVCIKPLHNMNNSWVVIKIWTFHFVTYMKEKKCTYYNPLKINDYFLRNATNTLFNTHFSTHSLWLIKIHIGPTKSCGSYIFLVGHMWILTNQRECGGKCVLEGVLLAFLLFFC